MKQGSHVEHEQLGDDSGVAPLDLLPALGLPDGGQVGPDKGQGRVQEVPLAIDVGQDRHLGGVGRVEALPEAAEAAGLDRRDLVLVSQRKNLPAKNDAENGKIQ